MVIIISYSNCLSSCKRRKRWKEKRESVS